jgi:hypothetical protein
LKTTKLWQGCAPNRFYQLSAKKLPRTVPGGFAWRQPLLPGKNGLFFIREPDHLAFVFSFMLFVVSARHSNALRHYYIKGYQRSGSSIFSSSAEMGSV